MINLLLIVVYTMSLFSCATIVKGSKQKITIKSNPVAVVNVTGRSGVNYFDGKIPATVDIKRAEQSYTVSISAEGYETQEIQLDRGLEMMFVGNICCCGPIGAVVDFASSIASCGATYLLLFLQRTTPMAS